MSEIEKAIEQLNAYLDDDTGYYVLEEGAAKTAISALEKQIPKKPIATVQTSQACPFCRFPASHLYCPNCGQRLEW